MLTEPRDGVRTVRNGALPPQRRPLTLASTLWTVPLLGGPVGWMWAGDWRWMVTGLLVAIATLIIGVTVTPPAR